MKMCFSSSTNYFPWSQYMNICCLILSQTIDPSRSEVSTLTNNNSPGSRAMISNCSLFSCGCQGLNLEPSAVKNEPSPKSFCGQNYPFPKSINFLHSIHSTKPHILFTQSSSISFSRLFDLCLHHFQARLCNEKALPEKSL